MFEINWAGIGQDCLEELVYSPYPPGTLQEARQQARQLLDQAIAGRRAGEPVALREWPPCPFRQRDLAALRHRHGLACERWLSLVALEAALQAEEISLRDIVQVLDDDLCAEQMWSISEATQYSLLTLQVPPADGRATLPPQEDWVAEMQKWLVSPDAEGLGPDPV